MFDQTIELLEIKGDNPFRTRAYRRAARTFEGLPKSVASLAHGLDAARLSRQIDEIDRPNETLHSVSTWRSTLIRSENWRWCPSR